MPPALVRGDAIVCLGVLLACLQYGVSGQIYNLRGYFDVGDGMIVKAKYENNVLKPLDKLDLIEGEEVDIELKKRSLFGLLKKWKINSQSLKDELRETNG